MKKYFLIAITISFTQLYAEVKIEDCASIESDLKRLACYDYLITGSSKEYEELSMIGNDSEDEVINNKQSDRDSRFGLSRSQREQAKNSSSKQSLSSSILEITQTFGGKSRFRLSNNQLWESQSNVKAQLGTFKVQSKVTIEESRMGGFWMVSKSSNVRIKVKRIA
ncbi:MAG: hypothetical protein CMD46_05205 [Gammaproteobacteria bacterium]|nr:hypothetical protein [Gammaproteobacteria bacterium]|tara:strand:+ start:10194 stop:10691 length:498 start_codon:yes stop_codon:yes gene_type:complete